MSKYDVFDSELPTRSFNFWIKREFGDEFVDCRVGTWRHAREFADGLAERSGYGVTFYDRKRPHFKSQAWPKATFEAIAAAGRAEAARVD